jgi:hypothetical protein
MALLETLRDPFRTLDPAVWLFTASQASIVSPGQLRVQAQFWDPGDPARGPSQLWSVGTFDLRDSALTVELADASLVSFSGAVSAGVFAGDPTVDGLRWDVRYAPASAWGFVLQAVRTLSGVDTVMGTLQPDPQEYRYLRISADTTGTVAWSTSPDGFTFTTAGTATGVPATLTGACRVVLGAWYESPGDPDAAGTVGSFDSVNLDPTAGDIATLTGDDGAPYLAVDVQPDLLTGAFVVGASLVGGPDLLAWSDDEPDTWLNVVCVVRSVSYQRGATRSLGLLTRTEAGTATVLLEDTAGQFDPNLNGGAIRKGTPWRLRAWGTDVDGRRWDAVLFTGELDGDLTAQYLPGEDAPLVTLTAQDLVGPLTAWESEGMPGDGAGDGDTLLGRAQRILTTVGRGEVSSASSSSYTATLAPTPLARPWDELQEAVTAELGRLWVDRHNRLQLRSRGSQPAGPVRGTLSDVHGEADLPPHACYAAAAVASSAVGMVNRALGSRRKLSGELTDPAQIRLDDDVSQRLYGTATANSPGLALQTDAQVTAWAGALITARTRPELRVDSVSPQPSTEDLPATLAQWPAVLQTDVGDRWLFHRHPPVGPAIFRGLAVLGVAVDVTPDAWTVTWTTEPAAVPGADNPTGWFVVGTSTLGGSDLLAPYSAPYAAA